MKPNDYIVKSITTWKDENGEDLKDAHGNYKLSIILSGVGEPADMTAKNLPVIGDIEYGHLEEYQTRAGKTRTKFMRDKKDDYNPQSQTKPNWQPKDERQITRNMVWKNLIEAGAFNVQTTEYGSEDWERFWAMVDLHTDMLLPNKENDK